MPVLFYLLCAMALGTGYVPAWLPALAWLFVLTRIVHSVIQCSCNRVMHRFAARPEACQMMGWRLETG